MTGYTVHVGTSEKYANNWDKIFGSDAPAESTKEQTAKPKKVAKAPQAKKQVKKKKA